MIIRNREGSHLNGQTREQAIFDSLFAVDPRRDRDEIIAMIRAIEKNFTNDILDHDLKYEVNKESHNLKYSDEQIEAGEWTEEDFDLAMEELRKRRIVEYFDAVALKYEPYEPVFDSMVRLDQEAEIAETLRNGKPVLIRGTWRIGKTSMAESLATHEFGRENSIVIELSAEGSYDYAIVQFLAEKNKVTEAEIEIQITESQKKAIGFLNDYLAEKDEKIFLCFDEAIKWAKHPEKLQQLDALKNLNNIQLGIILHRADAHEDVFKEIFTEYESYFVRALSLEEVRTLVCKPLEGTKITFTNDAIERLFDISGGRPIEVNNICHALMSKDSKHNNYKFNYGVQDINALIGMEDLQQTRFFHAIFYYYKRFYNQAIDEKQRQIVRKLIEEDEVSMDEIDADTVQPLIDMTFVVKDEDRKIYRINGLLFKQEVLN